MSFRGLFIAVLLSTAMIVSAFMIQSKRPRTEVARPTADLVKANGKCAECHLHETSAVVHEYEMSRHNEKGVNCLDCHQPTKGQEPLDHKGFTITKKLSSANCQGCHPQQYDQYLKSRHAAPAWAAVTGPADFTAEQIAFSEAIHKGAVEPAREPADGRSRGSPRSTRAAGSATTSASRTPTARSERARPATRGTPRRSSWRGFPRPAASATWGPTTRSLRSITSRSTASCSTPSGRRMNLKARPEKLTTSDMPVPTCATCHMSGLEGEKFTHDVTERLSYYLFATVSDRRPEYAKGTRNMKAICLKCHTNPRILKFYGEAEGVVRSTNALVKEAQAIVDGLHKDGLLTPEPFDEPIEYLYFDLWHYGGRTAKHGAYMGGADFVQWHGYYEIVSKLTELKKSAEDLRGQADRQGRRRRSRDEPPQPEAGVMPLFKVRNGGPTRCSGSSCSPSATSGSWRWTSPSPTRSTASPTRPSGSRWLLACGPALLLIALADRRAVAGPSPTLARGRPPRRQRLARWIGVLVAPARSASASPGCSFTSTACSSRSRRSGTWSTRRRSPPPSPIRGWAFCCSSAGWSTRESRNGPAGSWCWRPAAGRATSC